MTPIGLIASTIARAEELSLYHSPFFHSSVQRWKMPEYWYNLFQYQRSMLQSMYEKEVVLK